MADHQQLVQAKQILSSRLLRAGLRGDVVGMRETLSVSAAIRSASHNVHAVGIGRKLVNGDEVKDTQCVRVYVVQKLPDSLLPPRDRIPKEIEGIPTDVIQSAPAFLSARPSRRVKASAAATSCTNDRRKNQRPVVAGISAAHLDVTAGTIAYFCRSTRHGDDPSKVHVLSNNHVFANVNAGRRGDDLHQPGPADGGSAADHFAELHRFVEIALGGTSPNRVDAAIGQLLPGIEYRPEICKIGGITGTAAATEDLAVRKHGRTSGYTEGVITDVNYDALVGMDHQDPSVVALFEDQMRIQTTPPYPAFGLGGDSGSLVVSKSRLKAVGLYFAGPESGSYGVANHIEDVLRELEIALI